jgi:hypothetical protein
MINSWYPKLVLVGFLIKTSKKVSSRKIHLMGLHYKSFRFLDTLHHQKLKHRVPWERQSSGSMIVFCPFASQGTFASLRRSGQPHLGNIPRVPRCLVGIQCPRSVELGPRVGQEVFAINSFCKLHMVNLSSEA